MNAFTGTTSAATRLAPSTHKPWIPLPYMQDAVTFLCGHYAAGLSIKPGGRKTSITLAAFQTLRWAAKAQTMLVVAPLRVCRQTWRQEAKKWTEFRELKFALLHGSKKAEALRSGADVYLINYEGLAWLANQYMGRPLPFDIVCFDELTKMQNAQAERHKAIRPRLKGVSYRWGLTGSLFAKGHMSIFGQQLILDDGAALGRFITHYRDKYFQVSFNGFDYDLLPGAEKRITEAMAPYWFQPDESEYSQLPPIVDVPRRAQMAPAERKLYDQMKNQMVALLPEGEVTAANAGACYSKLAQMANGAVYLEDRSVASIHNLKLDMLEELVDELNGEPLLVGYEFNHDLARVQAWWKKRTGTDLPYLGKGTTAKQEEQWIQQWNRRELPLLFAHPQSAGHGLNMQEGQAYNVAWWSVTWDWELYDQFIRRVRRSGNENARIFNHLLIVDNTIDEIKLAAVHDKDFTEGRLVDALNTQILREQGNTGAKEMVAKLSRPGDGAQAQQATQQQAAPGGWGAAAQQQAAPQEPAPQQQAAAGGWGAVAPDQNGAQRERIQEQIAPQQDRSAGAQAAFSGGVANLRAGIANQDYGQTADDRPVAAPAQSGAAGGWGVPANQQQAASQQAEEPEKPKRTRSKKAQAETQQADSDDGSAHTEALQYAALMGARARVLAAVITSSPDMEVDDLVDAARAMMDFVERG